MELQNFFAHAKAKIHPPAKAPQVKGFSFRKYNHNFSSIVARLIIADTKITMDTREFSEDMFPQNECHCD